MSFNHTLRLYRPEDKRYHCGVKGCSSEATHVCQYDYRAYDAGGNSTVRLDRCREHAQRFKKMYSASHLTTRMQA